MCCILCEEPVRSLTIGLAAVGVVTIVRTVQKALKSGRRASVDTQAAPNESATATGADSAL